MNADKNSPKANVRLQRIKIVSRFVKYAIFALGSFSIIFIVVFSYGSFPKNNIWSALFLFSYQIVICIWYWKLTRLFRFYESGLIFASETIRCIKILGLVCMIGCIFKFGVHILYQPHPLPLIQSVQSHLAPGVTVKEVSVTHFQMGFFSFDFGTGFDFGLLLAGVVIVLVAWIMDEGRKIQEEQELTV